MRPPAIRRTRVRYLTNLTYHFGLKPWDIPRLRLWEFWTYVGACDDISRERSGGDAEPESEGRRRG